MKFLIPAFLGLTTAWITFMYFLVRDIQCIMKPTKLLQRSVQVEWYFLTLLSGLTFIAILVLWFGLLSNRKNIREYGLNTLSCLCILTLLNLPMVLVETSNITLKTSEKKMFNALKEYGKDYAATMQMDFFQTSLQCCGVFNYTDWKLNPRYNCSKVNINLCTYVPETCKQKPNKIFQVNSLCDTPMMRPIGNKTIKYHNLSEYQNVEDVIYTNGCLEYYREYRSSFLFWSTMYTFLLFLIQITAIFLDLIYRKYKIYTLLIKQRKCEEVELRDLDARKGIIGSNSASNRQDVSPDNLEENHVKETEQRLEETEGRSNEAGTSGDSATKKQKNKGLLGKKASYEINSNEQGHDLELCSNRKFSKGKKHCCKEKKIIFEKCVLKKIEENHENRNIPVSEGSENVGFQEERENEEEAENMKDNQLGKEERENEEKAENMKDKQLVKEERKNEEKAENMKDKQLVKEEHEIEGTGEILKDKEMVSNEKENTPEPRASCSAWI